MAISFSYDAHVSRVARQFQFAWDDATSVTASHLTRHTIRELIEYKYLATPWANGDLISIDSNYDEGTQSIDWFFEKDVDNPESPWMSPDGTFPAIDIRGEHQVSLVHTLGCMFKFDMFEAAAYKLQGLAGGDVAQRKGRAARRYHDRHFNSAVMEGVTGKFPGVINFPGSLQLVAGTAPNTTANWNDSGTDPEEITDTFAATFGAIFEGSKGELIPDSAVMPSNVMTRLRRQNSLSSDISILKWMKDTFPEITQWTVDPRLNDKGLGGTACMVMYNRQPDHIKAMAPVMLRPLPLYIKHQKSEQAFATRYAGLLVPYPTAIARLSGI